MLPGLSILSLGFGQLDLEYYDETVVENTTTITPPAGISSSGTDIAVMYDYAADKFGSFPTLTIPDGFERLASDTHTIGDFDITIAVSYGIITTEDALQGMDGNNYEAKFLFVFRANKPITTTANNIFDFQVTDGDPGSQTVNATNADGNNTSVIVLSGTRRKFSNGAFTTESPSFTANTFVDNLRMAYRVYNTTESINDHTVDTDDGDFVNILWSGMIEAA